MKTHHLSIIALAMLSLNACKPEESVSTPEVIVVDPALTAVFVSETLPDAQSIHAIRTTAKPGDTITIKGEVIGREKVFVDGRAAFIMGDPEKLTTCNKNPGDECETPWDACCDTKELKKASTVSVQILGEDGRVIAQGLKGVNGIKEMSSLTLSGVVDQSSNEDNLIINATRIHIEK